ncbi:hypothetical protein JTB14_026372 [Gonioctena quinquepunctata]|nr:hypothetical protein JTB14_026372 [Gonioctena quinquepunctata]
MTQDLPGGEARVKSVEPVEKESTSNEGLERVWSETKTPDGQPKKKARKTERGSSASMPTKLTFSPKVVLTREQMESVIKSSSQEKRRPQSLISTARKTDWVALMCANNTTMQWLKSTIEDIKPWEEAKEMLHGENLWINRGSKRKHQLNELEGTMESIRRPSRTPNAFG